MSLLSKGVVDVTLLPDLAGLVECRSDVAVEGRNPHRSLKIWVLLQIQANLTLRILRRPVLAVIDDPCLPLR